jgi:hypothetical protein
VLLLRESQAASPFIAAFNRELINGNSAAARIIAEHFVKEPLGVF